MSATLRKVLRLEGTTSLEVILHNSETKTAQQKFDELIELMKKDIEPELQTYIDSLKLPTALATVETIEQLEAVRVDCFPVAFKEKLADYIDALPDYTLEQKVWIWDTCAGMFAQGAQKQINPYFMKRAQEIANAKRIIH